MPLALLSVWDKTGLIPFASRLSAAGWRIMASGGTAVSLQSEGIEVTPISKITGEPEMLAGRVKTLHPAIHAALLARDHPEDIHALKKRGWSPIDLAVVNLYPFEKVSAKPGARLEEAIENIDIGGVALLRAAAKNYARVCTLSDPSDYPDDLEKLKDPDFRFKCARKAFSLTARYDSSISAYFSQLAGDLEIKQLTLYPVERLRYGENPHQQASFYSFNPAGSSLGGRLLQGKQLSYNNLLDLDAAWRAVQQFNEPAAVVLKHTSPCGIGAASTPAEALDWAIRSDATSAFGSVITINRTFDWQSAEVLGDLFVECIAAPSFTQDSLDKLAVRKNLRLLEMPHYVLDQPYEIRSILGGILEQSLDLGDPKDAPAWNVVTQRAPDDQELTALHFAWKACQYVKSNAIVLVSSTKTACFTVGIGGGQPNRVDCVRIAGERAGERAVGAVLASDAFFPFPDGVREAARLGVRAVIQPGGSQRDAEAIDEADRAGIAMVFTGYRHFSH
jgi:phosphoribosylaminoimidazolecarboxamide formyltransferase / IMP cyclohydrolase